MVWTRSLMLVAFNTFVSINFFLVEQVKTGCIMDMSRLDIILNDHNLFLIPAVMRYNSVLVLTMNTNGKVGARNCCLSYQLVNLSGPHGYLDIWNTEMLRYSNHHSDLITVMDWLTHSSSVSTQVLPSLVRVNKAIIELCLVLFYSQLMKPICLKRVVVVVVVGRGNRGKL